MIVDGALRECRESMAAAQRGRGDSHELMAYPLPEWPRLAKFSPVDVTEI